MEHRPVTRDPAEPAQLFLDLPLETAPPEAFPHPSGATTAFRCVALMIALPVHLLAAALWLPASALLRRAGVNSERIDRVTHALID